MKTADESGPCPGESNYFSWRRKEEREWLRVGFWLWLLMAVFIQPVANGQENQQIEEIVVTGSHIRTDNFSSSSPLLGIDSVDIANVGDTNIGQYLANVPSIVSTDTATNNNTNIPQIAGLNAVALRNLDRSRTLVLVNGRRYVSGTSAGAGYGVDLNSIPTGIIERVDVLTGNQSAVYGSDAVAGVINIVTKRDFEGVEIRAQFSESFESDNQKNDIDVTLGRNFSDGANIWASVGYSDHEGLVSGERDFSSVNFNAVDTDGDGLLDTPVFGGSSHIPIGRVGGFKGDGTPFVRGATVETSDALNFSDHRVLITPLERSFFASGLNIPFGERSSLTIEANYARVSYTTQLEANPLHTLRNVFESDTGGKSNIIIDPAAGPVHPLFDGTPLQTALIGAGFQTLDKVGATFRRTTELGDRVKSGTRTTYRVAAAFDHQFENDLHLNVYATVGRTDQTESIVGDINLERARFALDMEPDGFDGFQCADEIARLQGCVPFNPFNGTDDPLGIGWTPEASDYLRASQELTGDVKQMVLSSVLSGQLNYDLFSAGNPSFAVGVEYRDESGSETPDPASQAGIIRGRQILPTDGSFDVMEVFGELRVPIHEKLEIDAALRIGDYSTVGQAVTWKVGFNAPVTDWLRFRGAVSTAVRAPNISDLFAGGSDNANQVEDPCNGIDNTTAGLAADNCRSFPQIRARIDAEGAFELTQTQRQGTGGFTAGSELVQEETAESTTFGVVLAPEFIEGLSVAIDYYDIKIDDAIANASKTTVINRCYNVSTADFDPTCKGAALRAVASGALAYVDSIASNLNIFETSGVDLEVAYNTDVGPGNLNVGLVANFLSDFTVTGIETGEVDERTGEILYPDVRYNFSATYHINGFTAFWRVSYWDAVVDDNLNLASLAPNLNEFGSRTYHDLRLDYTINDNWNAYFGIRNVFDEQPGQMTTRHANEEFSSMTNATAWDVQGQRFFVGFKATF